MRGDFCEFGGATGFNNAAHLMDTPAQWSTTTGCVLGMSGSTPVWVIEAAKKLDSLGRLRQGWDSYGGLPLDSGARSLTVKVLDWLGYDDLPVPSVILGSGGQVHIEWHTKGRELEVELGRRGGGIGYVKVDANGDVEEGEQEASSPQPLRELTGWLLHGR